MTEVTVIALNKKSEATESGDHCTVSLRAHPPKIADRILRREIERKVEGVLGDDQFGLRRGCNWDTENNIRRNFGNR